MLQKLLPNSLQPAEMGGVTRLGRPSKESTGPRCVSEHLLDLFEDLVARMVSAGGLYSRTVTTQLHLVVLSESSLQGPASSAESIKARSRVR